MPQYIHTYHPLVQIISMPTIQMYITNITIHIHPYLTNDLIIIILLISPTSFITPSLYFCFNISKIFYFLLYFKPFINSFLKFIGIKLNI